MRFERLTSTSLSVAFHPRLTVITGVGPVERDAFAAALFGAVAGTTRGSTLELVDDRGRRLAVERHVADPARDRALDTATGAEVSDELRTPGGRVDLLAASGLTADDLAIRAVLTATDLDPWADERLARLAGHDGEALSAAVLRVLRSDAAAIAEAEAAIGRVEHAPADIEAIEAIHSACEVAEDRLARLGRPGLRFVFPAVAAAAITFVAGHRTTTLGLLGTIALVVLALVATRQRVGRLRRQEHAALAVVGASSYTVFHMRRVDELLEGQADRQRLANAAHGRSAALSEWRHIAGDASVEWVLANRDRIAEARRRAMHVRGGGAEAAEIAQAVIARMADLREGAEPVPLLLDDPFSSLDLASKQWLLELVGRSAGSPQCVLLTDDPDVVAWARMEAITGELSIVGTPPVDITTTATQLGEAATIDLGV